MDRRMGGGRWIKGWEKEGGYKDGRRKVDNE